MSNVNYDDIHITNDFMFGYVMSDEGRCKLFLEQILGVNIHHIEFLEKQKTIDARLDSRSIRMDLYVGDGSVVYDVEMQTTDSGNLSKRSRYYQSVVDTDLLKKGENFSKLKKSIIIFVCTFDPFGEKRYLYTFKNLCVENPTMELNDEATKLFVNTQGEYGAISDEFISLMRYFNNPSEAEKTSNPLVSDIDQAVKAARTNEEWRHDYMTWEMYGNEKFFEGKEKGFEEGCVKTQRETIERMILKKKYDFSEIAELAGVPVEVVKEIEAALSIVK